MDAFPHIEPVQVPRAGTVLEAEVHGPSRGPLVVFTHGGWMDRRMFDGQVQPMVATGYRVLLWDLRGHGASVPHGLDEPTADDMSADLLALLDEVNGSDRAVLVGQSLGGMVSQRVVLESPQRAAGLVTIGAPCINPTGRGVKARLRLAWRLSGMIGALLPTRLIRKQLPQGTATTSGAREYVRATTSGVTREDFGRLVDVSRGAGDGLQGKRFAVPVLATRGALDASAAGRLTAMTARRWPVDGGRFHYEEIPEAGHQAHQDNPEAFNRLLLAFLAELAQ
ncbi:alpha/beta fold hydrolase [Pseudactinotalea sp. Z1748]|uniref:alpha/beta fold hydrolase n=1 Tax=Pseudactinotalea sp. Z1748 TaxID=3413027 RepID=UPI003C7E6AAD